jgi:ABC-type Na+ efflux pump permease subunit
MNGREWFIVGTRLFGIWMLCQAVSYIGGFIDLQLGYRNDTGYAYPTGYLVQAGVYLLLSMFLLFGARNLANYCYDRDQTTEHKNPENQLKS